MDDKAAAAASCFGDPQDCYEKPQIFDLGAVVAVTNGSSTGGADSNGQGLY